MLKIGDFSRLSRISVRMLRHYDEIGLLKPAVTDELIGYRYYREDQLFVTGRITSLKNMGFSLTDIIRILDLNDDIDVIDTYLIEKQKELMQTSDLVKYRLKLIDHARKQMKEGITMNYDITVKTIPERYAATVQMVIPRYEDEGLLWNMLAECRKPLIPADPCLSAAQFLDQEYKEENVEVLIWMTVKGTYENTEHIRFRTLPAVKVESCILNEECAKESC